MDHARIMVEYLEVFDVSGMQRLWREVAPLMPQHDDADTEIKMHMTRTMLEQVKFRHRAYSHCWLTERGLPSQLPDELRPKAERFYPVVKPAVGIMVSSKYPLLKREITRAMSDAVLEAEADGRLNDDDFVRGRMLEARANIKRKLFG